MIFLLIAASTRSPWSGSIKSYKAFLKDLGRFGAFRPFQPLRAKWLQWVPYLWRKSVRGRSEQVATAVGVRRYEAVAESVVNEGVATIMKRAG